MSAQLPVSPGTVNPVPVAAVQSLISPPNLLQMIFPSNINEQDIIGPTDETMPTTDVAPAGLNGRLQRIAVNQALATATLAPLLAQIVALLQHQAASEYETVGQNATRQALGGAGAIGDYLESLLVTPLTTSPGQISIWDGNASIIVFQGGPSSVSNLVPFTISLNMTSLNGAWQVSTGASVQCVGNGNFT